MTTMQGALILIVEDEVELAEIFRGFFEREGFRVVLAHDGRTGVALHSQLSPRLVVLDVRLPLLDGFEVLASLRRVSSTPIIMSTALGEDLEKLTALTVGADDYLVKPFNPLELVARAKAVLRRTSGEQDRDTVMRIANLEIDFDAHQARGVRPEGSQAPLNLTVTEFRILAHLARKPNRVSSRSELVESCLPRDRDALDRTVDSHVRNLRAKLAAAGLSNLVEGVRGIGYRLVLL